MISPCDSADWARNSPDAIANLTLAAASKARIPLSEVASIQLRSGESTITREMGRRQMTVKNSTCAVAI